MDDGSQGLAIGRTSGSERRNIRQVPRPAVFRSASNPMVSRTRRLMVVLRAMSAALRGDILPEPRTNTTCRFALSRAAPPATPVMPTRGVTVVC
jgi:hypothetical protein